MCSICVSEVSALIYARILLILFILKLCTLIIVIFRTMSSKQEKPVPNGITYDDPQVEMDFIRHSPEKRTRFQVNRVRTESANKYENDVISKKSEESQSEDDDLLSATDRTRLSSSDYAQKSLRCLYF